jgi:hypothetical protein
LVGDSNFRCGFLNILGRHQVHCFTSPTPETRVRTNFYQVRHCPAVHIIIHIVKREKKTYNKPWVSAWQGLINHRDSVIAKHESQFHFRYLQAITINWKTVTRFLVNKLSDQDKSIRTDTVIRTSVTPLLQAKGNFWRQQWQENAASTHNICLINQPLPSKSPKMQISNV